MNKELKRQLILSGGLLFLLVFTLIIWYQNFVFHTYVSASDYQYCFRGENDSLIIDGYEFYKNEWGEKNGKARVVALTDLFFQKGDLVEMTFEVTTSQAKTYSYSYEKEIEVNNEVFYLVEEDTLERIQDFSTVEMTVSVIRDDETVYEESIPMYNQNLVVYNGGNKDYTIQEVYVSSSWLKTGLFSSTKKGIEEEYPYMSIDYLYLKEDGNEDDLNDYERFAYIKSTTQEILSGQLQSVAYYDDSGSLLERELCCVVTLMKDEDAQDVYTFVIPLHGTIKVGEGYE